MGGKPEAGAALLAEIVYETDLAEESRRLKLRVAPDGVATLTVDSNKGAPAGIPGVGLFQAPVAGERIARLNEVLQGKPFYDIPPLSELDPGTAVRSFTITPPGGASVVRDALVVGAAPAPFSDAEQIALAIVAEVAKHPLRVMGLRLAPLPAKIKRGEPLALKLSIVNLGTEPFRTPHPRRWQQEFIGVFVTGLRNDIPLAELRDHHRFHVNVSATEVRSIAPDPDPRPKPGAKEPEPLAGTILLPPRQQVDLSIELPVTAPAGRYGVEIGYEVGAGARVDGEEVLPGHLIAAPGTLTILE